MSRCPSTRNNAVRVAFFTPGMNCGGAERWCLTLARNFSPAVRVSGFMSGGKGILTREAERIAPVFHPLQAKQLLASTDILIAWGWEHLERDTEGFRGRIIAVSHGEPGGEWQDKVTAAMARTPRVELTGVSSRSLDAWPGRGTGHYIPNGVEVDRVTPRFGRSATRRALGLEDGQKAALFVGRLSPEKRPWLMHEMLPYLPEEWVAVVCGPDMAGYIPGWVDKPRMIVVSPVHHPGDILAAADLFILPSETEAHPLALTEAWLAGTPSVYCDWPFAQQIRETHGTDLGTVVPVGLDGETLAEAVCFYDRDQLVELARGIAWEHYTASVMAARWEKFLDVAKPVTSLVFR